MMTSQQVENYIQQILRSQEQQNSTAAQTTAALTSLQTSLSVLSTTVANLTPQSGSGASAGNIYDTYQVNGGILHKLITTFNAAVTFASTVLISGIATFSAAPVLSALTASLPLQLTSGKAITAALINISSMITGILKIANGGTGVSLAATGGTSQVLKQVSSGANVTVGQLATTDLSDVSTGSWTPAINFGGAAVGVTYSSQNGFYRRVGNLIVVSFVVVLTNKGSSTGVISITGLPSSAVAGTSFTGSIYLQNFTYTSGGYVMISLTLGNVGVFYIDPGGNPVALTDAATSNTSIFGGTAVYSA